MHHLALVLEINNELSGKIDASHMLNFVSGSGDVGEVMCQLRGSSILHVGCLRIILNVHSLNHVQRLI
jgi:hypothetical protein